MEPEIICYCEGSCSRCDGACSCRECIAEVKASGGTKKCRCGLDRPLTDA